MSLGDIIDKHNSVQEKQIKDRIRPDDITFPWEDANLLSLLSRPIEPVYERSGVSSENEADEKIAISQSNQVIKKINSGCLLEDAENELSKMVEDAEGYRAYRLQFIASSILEKAWKKKGLLIYGEGGIGKTFFLYDLVGELKKEGVPYVVSFSSQGVREINEIGIPSIADWASGQFTLIIDACNELDDDTFMIAKSLVEKALSYPLASVVVSTRKDSPDSRMDELAATLPTAVMFEGVDAYAALDAVSGFPDAIYIQYQPFLLSNNPRIIKETAAAIIKKLSEDQGEKTALIQRTTLVEHSIKSRISIKAWESTKKVCSFLYRRKQSSILEVDVIQLLGASAGEYLTQMLEHGYIREFRGSDGVEFFFSSESQLQWLIARSVNDDLDNVKFDENIEDASRRVAEIIESNSTSLTVHEMCQAAIDRFIDQGAEVFRAILLKFQEFDLDFDFARIIIDTIFPENFDLDYINSKCRVTADEAFGWFAGFVGKPLNLTSFANERLLANQGVIDSFFVKNWRTRDLDNLILRVKNIAEFVARTGVVPEESRKEWLWLAVWSSWSPESRLSSWAQRLMFVLCDKCLLCTELLIEAWDLVKDVYVRRAIANTILHLSESQKTQAHVVSFLQSAVNDQELTDSVTISYLIDASGGDFSFTDFASKNIYAQYVGKKLSEDDFNLVSSMVWHADLLFKGFLPIDIYRLGDRAVEFEGLGWFVDVQKRDVKIWNERLTSALPCAAGGKCEGWSIHKEDIEGFCPIPFELNHLNDEALLCALVDTFRQRFIAHGGNLEEQLGTFSGDYTFNQARTPNLKVMDEAVRMLLGSLAANYFTNELALCIPPKYTCGFMEYEERRYQEPEAVHVCVPTMKISLDRAKKKLEERFASPEGKPEEWFDNYEDIPEELVRLIDLIEIKKLQWRPLALTARKKVKDDSQDRKWTHNLKCSSEYLISVAFNSDKHICDDRDDRMLTIEHEEFKGNVVDYENGDSSRCLWLPSPDVEKDNPRAHQILLPPQTLVRALNLSYVQKEGVFVDEDGAIAIICDGECENYFEDSICNLILLRADLFERLLGLGGCLLFRFFGKILSE